MALRQNIVLLFLMVSLLFASSCVSKKKYNKQFSQLTAVEKRIPQLKDSISYLINDTIQYGIRFRSLESAKNYLEQIVNAEKSFYTDSDEESTDNNTSDGKIKPKDVKLNELSEVVSKQNKLLKTLNDKIKVAIAGYKSSEATVSFQGNRIIITLYENLLFKQGSSVLLLNGKEAIEKISIVLEKTNDFEIKVEANSDNTASYRANFEDNWMMTASRAVVVSRALIYSGVSSKRVIPVSRGDSNPIVSNQNLEQKYKNQRVEIIIQPLQEPINKILREF